MLQFLVLQDGLVVELKQDAQHQPLQFSLVNYTGKHRTLCMDLKSLATFQLVKDEL